MKFDEIRKTWQMPASPDNALFSGIQSRVFVLPLFQSDGKIKAQGRQAERIDDFLVSQQMANAVQQRNMKGTDHKCYMLII